MSRDVIYDLDRQMRAAEHRRRRVIVAACSISGALVLGTVMIAGALITTRGDADDGAPVAVTAVPRAPATAAGTAATEAAPVAVEDATAEELPADKPAAEPVLDPPSVAPSPTTPALQEVSIGIGDSGFEPTVVTVKAGAPVQLTVAQGDGCAAGFLIPELGISADNSIEPAVVSLSALEPGMYRFTCGMEMVEGRLVVQ